LFGCGTAKTDVAMMRVAVIEESFIMDGLSLMC
jgi:hypothetical protein